MKTHLLLGLITLPLVGFAQSKATEARVSENTRARTEEVENGYDVFAFNSRDKSVRGTPMLSSQWQPAEILLVGNAKPLSAPAKYDMYQHQLRVRRAQGDSILLPATRVQEFSLSQLDASGNRQPHRFVRYESSSLPTELNGAYAEVLSGGNSLQLLKFWNKKLIKEAENTTNISSTSTIQRYDESNKYYVRWANDGRLIPVRLKRGSLKDALATQPDALKVLEEQKGSLSTEVEVAAAIVAINTRLNAK
jgi:hypothetical protein